jgi:hypothetical protein
MRESIQPTLEAWDPFYIVRSTYPCWRCKRAAPVIAIMIERSCGLGEDPGEEPQVWEPPLGCQYPEFLTNIQLLSPELLAQVQAVEPGFRLDRSRAGGEYYMNHCKWCGAHFGDFFLHQEVDGPFDIYAIDEIEAKGITVQALPALGAQKLACGLVGSDATYWIHGTWWRAKVHELAEKLSSSTKPDARDYAVALQRVLAEFEHPDVEWEERMSPIERPVE